MTDKELKLKVAEAIQDDVNKGIVRIDSGYLSEVDIKPGDIVEIESERKTVAIADRSYPGDIGLNIIRMDGIIRKNAKTGIGEIVRIRKALVKEAKKIIIAPARKGIVIRASSEIFKQGLLGRAVVRGDIVSLGGARRRKTTMMNNPFFDEDIFSILDESMMGIGFGDIKFVVVDTNPKQAVIILDQTEIEFRSEAVEIEEERVPDITYEDVGGLEDEIKKVREMVELPLKHPEIFERLGIEAPKGVLLHGPPGTGKTLLAKAVANETNSHFILINGPEIMSKYYGQSLPYDEKILVVEDNLLKRVPIGKIVENNNKNLKVVCFDDKGKVVISKITDLIKHKNSSKILKIKTRSGRVIRVTDFHSLFTLGKNGIEDIKTSDLIANKSFIAVPKRLPFAENPINKLDLLEVLRENDHGLKVRGVQHYIKEAISKRGHNPVADNLGIKSKYLYDFLCKNVGISVSKFVKLMEQSKIKINNEDIKICTKGKSFPSILEFNEDFCAFLGLWTAEGSYTNKNEVRLSIHRKEEKAVKELCNKLFGHVTIYHKPNFDATDICICSGILGIIMKKVLGFNSNARQKKIPDIVHNFNRSNMAAFLRGYFSGDGSLNTKTPAPMVEVCTESPELADDIAYLLLYFGIVAKIYSRKDRQQKRICFADYENLNNFRDIGFFDSERNLVIYNYLSRIEVSRRDRIPITGEIKDIVGNNHYLRSWQDQESIGKNILLRLKNPKIEKILNSDIYWDKVTSIEEVKGQFEFVYDISVEPCQNFIAGFGGIFAHNSEENLRKKFEEAEKNAPSIIFIDEIDAIASKREETRGEVERRVVAQLLALMDGLQSRGKVVVIAATNVPNILDPALRRPGRFDREIEIGVPGKEGRLNILKIHTRNMPLYTKENIVKESDFEPEYKEAILNLLRYKDANSKGIERAINKYLVENPEKNELFKKIEVSKLKKYMEKLSYDAKTVSLKELAEITHGFVGADIASLAKEAAMIVLRRVLPDIKLKEDEPLPKELLERLIITQTDFKESLKVVRPSALREVLVEIPNIKWSDIGGLVNVKQELIEAVEWPLKHPESFKRLGVRPPKGILLFGAPGTGKTLLAKAVANESEANFILVKGPELLCLSKDTPIFTDYCGVRVIENFFENIKPYSTLEKENDKIEVRSLNENFYTVGIDKEGKLTKTKIIRATKIYVDHAYKIKFDDNNRIQVSKNQPFFVYRNGKIDWVKAENLQLNDFVAKPSSLISFDKEIKFNMPKYKHLRLVKADKDSYYVKIFSSHKATKLPKKLSVELAEFLGWFSAEGNISKDQVCVCNENLEHRKAIRKLFSIFADENDIKQDKDKLFIYSTPLIKFLEDIFEMKLALKKSYIIKVPPAVTKSSKDVICAFLRGAYKGDGHIDNQKIEYGTMSEDFAQTMTYLLSQMSIKAKYWQRKDGMNMVTISGKKEMSKFLEYVMNQNVKVDERKYYNAKYIIPDVSGLLREAKARLDLHYGKEMPEGLFEGVISGRKRCGLLRLRRMMIYLEKYMTEEFRDSDIYKTLKMIAEGDLSWTRVKSIDKADAQWMYDLETENDSFVGGNLPLILHNSKWVGESEKAVREVFKKARQVSPCIIFFDEVDALAPRRGMSSDSHVSERVVNQLLTEIDGLEDLHDVVVIAATNRPDIVDTALLRPGRFDRMILTNVPDEATRLEIFKVHTKGMPIALEAEKRKKMVAAKTIKGTETMETEADDNDDIKSREDMLRYLSDKTQGYVGADIEAVCREAAILALREDINSKEIYKKHFEKALEKVRPSVTKDVEKAYEELQEHFTAARAKQMLDEKPGYMG